MGTFQFSQTFSVFSSLSNLALTENIFFYQPTQKFSQRINLDTGIYLQDSLKIKNSSDRALSVISGTISTDPDLHPDLDLDSDLDPEPAHCQALDVLKVDRSIVCFHLVCGYK